MPKNEPLNLHIQDVQPLNRYSVEARYPGEWEPIDEFEARDALEMVRVVRGVFRRWSLNPDRLTLHELQFRWESARGKSGYAPALYTLFPEPQLIS